MNERQESKSEEKFERMVTVLIASTAILVAVIVYFQNYASNLSGQARRRAQEYIVASTKTEINGAIQFNYQWHGAFQTWKELDLQKIAAVQSGDTAAVERYSQLQERMTARSDMLGPKYFDSFTSWPDSYKYEADLYLVESVRLSESYLAEAEVGRNTDNTTNDLAAQITLLTVSLSLYGLSMAIKEKVRWLFVSIGFGIVVVCIFWLSVSVIDLLSPPEINRNAINAFAEGVGLSYQKKYAEAISSFKTAVAEKPDYGNAYYELGFAYFDKGDIVAAVENFESARKFGLDDPITNWNLGWGYYLIGQYPQGIEADERALTKDPGALAIRMNEAISYLAMGHMDQAQHQYDLTILEAERQVNVARQNGTEPSASFWYFMDAGAIDLQNLIDQLDNDPKSWTLAPDSNLVAGDHSAIRDFAHQQMVRLKETTVSLEQTGKMPKAQTGMRVQPFKFGQITETDTQGFITDFKISPDATFPFGTDAVTAEFTYSGPAPKQIIWKVYVNGFEDLSLRIVQNDDISSGKTWYQTFGYIATNLLTFTPGEYVVELYADSKLVRSGKFYIEE